MKTDVFNHGTFVFTIGIFAVYSNGRNVLLTIFVFLCSCFDHSMFDCQPKSFYDFKMSSFIFLLNFQKIKNRIKVIV